MDVIAFNDSPPESFIEDLKNLLLEVTKIQLKQLMDHEEGTPINAQTDQVLADLLAKVAYYMNEYDLNEYTLMGILEAVKMELKESMETYVELDDEHDIEGDSNSSETLD